MHSLLWKQNHCINVYWDTIFLNSQNLYRWFGYTCLFWIHKADAVTFTELLFVSTELHRILAYARTPMPAYYTLPCRLFKFFLAFFQCANIVVIQPPTHRVLLPNSFHNVTSQEQISLRRTWIKFNEYSHTRPVYRRFFGGNRIC